MCGPLGGLSLPIYPRPEVMERGNHEWRGRYPLIAPVVLAVMIVGFFAVNLFLAVIFSEYASTQGTVMAAFNSSGLTGRTDNGTARSVGTARSNSVFGGTVGDAKVQPAREGPAGEQAELGASDSAALLHAGSALSDGGISGPKSDVSAPTSLLKTMANSDALSNATTILVLLNMALMCMPYDGMSSTYALRLEWGSTLISCIFIAEMALKLAGLGCIAYWADGWNRLDGTIVSLSVVEMAATAIASGTGTSKLSFLRTLSKLGVLVPALTPTLNLTPALTLNLTRSQVSRSLSCGCCVCSASCACFD